MSTCYSYYNVQEVWCLVLDLLNHGWPLYARPFVAPPPLKLYFFFCWSLPIQQYCTAVQDMGLRYFIQIRPVLRSSKEVAAAVLHGVVVLK